MVIKKCERCKKEFKVFKCQEKRIFCSLKCKWGTIYKNCIVCDKKFKINKKRVNTAKFCSYKCRGINQSKNIIGKKNPNWGGGKINRKCLICEKNFKTLPSVLLKKSGKYCSNKCRGIAHSKMMKGLNTCNKNPMWKGGIVATGDKKYLLTRVGSNYILSHRLLAEQQLKRKLSDKEVIHHIDGNSLNNNIENLYLFKDQAEHIKFHFKKNKEFIKSNIF